MTAFDKALAHVAGVEGGYSDHKDDRGGRTMLGVTEGLARKYGWTGPMSGLTNSFAESVYRREFWDPMRGDEIAAVSEPIAIEMFDTGVNMGASVATRFLQRALNVFNRGAADWHDIAVDGVVGPATLRALKAMIAKRGKNGERVLLRALNSQQGERYLGIAEKNPSQESFAYGWFLNRVEIP